MSKSTLKGSRDIEYLALLREQHRRIKPVLFTCNACKYTFSEHLLHPDEMEDKLYEKALQAASEKLTECYNRQQDYSSRLADAKAKQNDLAMEVQVATVQYEHYRDTLGDTNSATIAAKQNMEAAQQEYAEATAEVEKLAGQNDAVQRSTQNAADAVSTAQSQLNKAQAAVKETEAAIKQTNQELKTAQSAWTAAGKVLEDFSKKAEKVGKSATQIGKSLTTTVTTPIFGLATGAVKASVEFESAFAGVRKTVDASEAEFDELAGSIKQMSTEVAASTTDIASVVETAGQLGIENSHLMEFARTMIDLGNSTNMQADEAASQAARFANIMGMSQSQFQNLGSTLVDLGNNYATTESEIMAMSLRLAGAGKQVGLSEAEILGFAAALSSVGIEAQMGGSAFSKALVKMEVAAATGGEALDDFAKVSSMTSAQFKNIWENDPAAAFQAFITGLSRMDEQGVSAIATLNDIGISEIRLRDTLLRATNATELFSKTQVTAKNAWKQNTALTTEANKRYATTESRLTNLKNKAVLFAQTIGSDLSPMINQIIDGVGKVIERFSSMDASTRQQIIRVAGIAAAIGPAILVFGKLSTGVGKVTSVIGTFATAVGKAGGGFSGFMSVLSKSPAVWLAVAAAVVVGTVALADYLSGAKATREALKGLQETAENWKNTAAETFYGKSEGLSFFGMSKDDFVKRAEEEKQTAAQWMSGMIAVWSDGKRETNDIVKQWQDSWKSLTGTTREGLTGLKSTADKNGYTSLSSQMGADLKQLDSIDKEMTSLLKRRQNKNLSDKDKVRIQELIDTRNAIMVKYKLVPESEDVGGFDTLQKKFDAEVARAEARGQQVTISTYENAIVGAAQGLAAINGQLDEYTEVKEGADKASLTPSGLLAYVATYAEATTGTDVSSLNPSNITAMVAAYKELAAGADVSTLKPSEITAYIMQYLEKKGVDTSKLSPDAVTAFVMAYEELTGGASTSALTPSNITAMVVKYAEAEGIDLSALSPDQITALVNTFAEATGCDKSSLMQNFVAYIAEYKEAAGVKKPTLNISVGLTGYDLLSYRRFVKNNKVTVDGIVKLSELYQDPSEALGEENVKFWKDGIEIPAKAVTTEMLKPSDLAVLDADGTMHILITTEVTGAPEAIEEMREQVAEVDQLGMTPLGTALTGIMLTSTLGMIKAAEKRIETAKNDLGQWYNFIYGGDEGIMKTLDQSMQLDFSPERVAELATYVAEVVSAIQQGNAVSQEDMDNLNTILQFVQDLDAAGVGGNVSEGIAEGMVAVGRDGSA